MIIFFHRAALINLIRPYGTAFLLGKIPAINCRATLRSLSETFLCPLGPLTTNSNLALTRPRPNGADGVVEIFLSMFCLGPPFREKLLLSLAGDEFFGEVSDDTPELLVGLHLFLDGAISVENGAVVPPAEGLADFVER